MSKYWSPYGTKQIILHFYFKPLCVFLFYSLLFHHTHWQPLPRHQMPNQPCKLAGTSTLQYWHKLPFAGGFSLKPCGTSKHPCLAAEDPVYPSHVSNRVPWLRMCCPFHCAYIKQNSNTLYPYTDPPPAQKNLSELYSIFTSTSNGEVLLLWKERMQITAQWARTKKETPFRWVEPMHTPTIGFTEHRWLEWSKSTLLFHLLSKKALVSWMEISNIEGFVGLVNTRIQPGIWGSNTKTRSLLPCLKYFFLCVPL